MTTSVFVFAFSVAAATTTATTAPTPRLETGRVTYVTAAAAFVDQGSADGVVLGQTLELVRKKRRVATCAITSIAAHHAVCTSDRAEPGDRFSFVSTSSSPSSPSSSSSSQGAAWARSTAKRTAADARLVDERRAIIVNTPITKVRVARVRAAATPAWAVHGEIALRHQAWATFNATDASFQKPVLDAGVRANLGFIHGLQLGSALRLAGDALAPASTRFRAADTVELTVWETGLFLDAPREPWVASVGRFRPRRAPGAPLVDGALIAGRALEGSLEVGAYGGAMPDAVTLAPRFDRVAGGVYFAVDAPLADDVVFLPRARIGVVSTSDLADSEAEIETQAQLCFGNALVIGAGARIGVDGRTLVPALDSAHASIDHRPTETVTLRAGYRWIGTTVFDLDRIGGTTEVTAVPAVAAAHHADAATTWEAAPWITVGAMGGVAALLDAALVVPGAELATVRGWVGPQIVLPGVLLGGDLAISHIEELGAFAGRSSYLQSTHWLGDARLVARISYFETDARQEALREGGALLGVDVPLFTWLTLQGRAQSIAALPAFDGHARATPINLIANAGLSSRF